MIMSAALQGNVCASGPAPCKNQRKRDSTCCCSVRIEVSDGTCCVDTHGSTAAAASGRQEARAALVHFFNQKDRYFFNKVFPEYA